MKRIKVKPNQNIFDIAVECYGNINAVEELIDNNPSLRNDPDALPDEIDPQELNDGDFFLDTALMPEDEILFDETSPLILRHILRKIQNPITTYVKKDHE